MRFDFALHKCLGNFRLSIAHATDALHLAILGPSGSGKSVTLSLLAGFLKPDAGHIHFQGEVWYDSAQSYCRPASQRRVGMVFQDYALFPHLTVAQNIAFSQQQGLWNPSRRRIPFEVAYWLERMQLARVAHHYPHQISGGQAQRAALARACLMKPRVLFLDEPFSALDTELRAEMRQLVWSLCEELAMPSILITHDPADVGNAEVVRISPCAY